MASTALAKRKAAPPARVTEQLALLEEAIGGRDALVAALSHAPKSRDLTLILGLVGNPLEAKTPLAVLCAEGGITAGELIEAYRAGELHRAQALAIAKVGQHLPAVAEDTMRLALPHCVTCGTCRGTGSWTPEPTKKQPNPAPEPCELCTGTGQLTLGGDLDHKKLALEMGKLLPKGGGGLSIAVNQQLGISFGSAGGALEKLQAATDQILYGEAPPVSLSSPATLDAEVLESSPEIAAEEAILEGDWRSEVYP